MNGLHYRVLRQIVATLVAAVGVLWLAPPVTAQAGGASAATYEVTFQGNWTTASTPDGVVAGAHFTTLIGAVHNGSVTFWSPGGRASPGVEVVAERGVPNRFESEIKASPHAAAVIKQSIGGGGTSTATFLIDVARDHPLVTLLSMIGPSPDWFVGIHGAVAAGWIGPMGGAARGRPVSLRCRHRGGHRVLARQPPPPTRRAPSPAFGAAASSRTNAWPG